MYTPQDFEKGNLKRYIKMALVGASGAGKTHLASTFPKCLFAITAPGEEDTFTNNPSLLKNIVGWEYFIPYEIKDTKQVVESLDKFCLMARDMATKGEIKTFVFDNITFWAEYLWWYIQNYEKDLHLTRTGQFDVQNGYGTLKDKLEQFVLMRLLTIPCNVIINVHLMTENDEVMEKKLDKTMTFSPSILGGFRNKIQGMVSYVFYLDKIEDKTKKGNYLYYARTNKGSGKEAKSRLALPAIIENISYNTITSAINDSLKQR